MEARYHLRKKTQIDQMKAMFFLFSENQKRYIFLFKKMMDRDNVGRYEYPIKITPALDLLILTEVGISGHQ